MLKVISAILLTLDKLVVYFSPDLDLSPFLLDLDLHLNLDLDLKPKDLDLHLDLEVLSASPFLSPLNIENIENT